MKILNLECNLLSLMQVLDLKRTMEDRSRWFPHLKKALETLHWTYTAFISQLDRSSYLTAKAGSIAKLLHGLLAYYSLSQNCAKIL